MRRQKLLPFSSRWPVLIPLALLGIDVLMFPFLFHTHPSGEKFSLDALLRGESIHLGRYKGHKIHVVLDDIAQDDYLQDLADSKNALVITHFLVKDKRIPASRMGALGQTVNRKLQRLAPDRSAAFFALLEGTKDRPVGAVIDFATHFERSTQEAFPLDHIFIILFEEASSSERKTKIIKSGLENVLRKSGKHGVENLFIPSLTIDPQDPDKLPYQDFFAAAFSAISTGTSPANIYFAMYENWPNRDLQQAVLALDEVTTHLLSQSLEKTKSLYRADYRLMMFFLALCLLVCSYTTTLTLKNSLVISTTFLLGVIGAQESLNFLMAGFNEDLTFMIKLAFLVVFSLGYRWIIFWNPQSLFSSHRRTTHED